VSNAPFFYSSAAGKSNTSLSSHIDIVQLVGEYVALRRSGRQFFGLCPFHKEQTPSFAVDPDKGAYYCHGGCARGGDAIDFYRRIEGVDFKTAIARLGIARERIPPAERERRRADRQATEALAAWAFETVNLISTRMRGFGQRETIARQCLLLPDADLDNLRDEIDFCSGEFQKLADLQDAIVDPTQTIELWRSRREIELFLGDELDPLEEPDTYVPNLTANYRQKLFDIVREMVAA
jgi:DNA primase